MIKKFKHNPQPTCQACGGLHYGSNKCPYLESDPGGHIAAHIKEKLYNLISQYINMCDQNKISVEKRFIEDLNFDSLDQIELLMAIEETFNISADDAEAEKCSTIQEAIDLISNKVRGK